MSEVVLRRYPLPSVQQEGWAIIVTGSDGFFAAISDYGNYSYIWRDTGHKDFRFFLLGMERDPGYFLRKFAPQREYDGEATVKAIKKQLLKMRLSAKRRALRKGKAEATYWTKERVREEWELIDDESVEDNVEGFRSWCERTKLEEAWEYHVEMDSPQAKAFMEKVIPRFVELLKKELEEEKADDIPW